MPKRPRMFKIDTEMRRCCALLEEEVSNWPLVKTKPMFGMIAFYRDKTIFAAIPRTRAAETEKSVLIKLPGTRDERFRKASGPGAGWVTFEVWSANDITEALRWLEQAYNNAKGRSH